jgi:hypothetical protein
MTAQGADGRPNVPAPICYARRRSMPSDRTAAAPAKARRGGGVNEQDGSNRPVEC